MPSPNHAHTPELAALVPAYALGALDGEEKALLESHLAAGCPECERELQRWSGDLEELAASLPPVVPSEMIRTRVLRSLDDSTLRSAAAASPRPVDRGTRRLPAWLAVAAALVLAVWSGWAQIGLRRQAERLIAERDSALRQVAALGDELTQARTETVRLTRAMEILSAPDLKPVALAALGGQAPGPDRAGGASGHAFVDPLSRRALFLASNLAPAPSGRTYQLWFIADGKPVSAGIFAVGAGGRAGLEVDDVAPVDHIQAWAVTVEPAGGVPQPTGEMVLKG